ncbi:hypothetical protein Ddc_00596 [Ditylenchus destructor]|nr:hypothetical protein Ddc_00596 [Ditylenchus destructor]
MKGAKGAPQAREMRQGGKGWRTYGQIIAAPSAHVNLAVGWQREQKCEQAASHRRRRSLEEIVEINRVLGEVENVVVGWCVTGKKFRGIEVTQQQQHIINLRQIGNSPPLHA